jgi:hypothetical protein
LLQQLHFAELSLHLHSAWGLHGVQHVVHQEL